MKKGAIFSPCRAYRYLLTREWGEGPVAVFVGLNPSTADENVDDPTIRREIRFAREWGFDGLWKLNLFGFRATDPAEMKRQRAPVGSENDFHLCGVCTDPRAGVVVAAWGTHGNHQSRAWIVRRKLLPGVAWMCLGKTKGGAPRHPLYVRADQPLTDFS